MKVEVIQTEDGTTEKIFVDGKMLITRAGVPAISEEGDPIRCPDVADWMQKAFEAGWNGRGTGNPADTFYRIGITCPTMDEFNAVQPFA